MSIEKIRALHDEHQSLAERSKEMVEKLTPADWDEARNSEFDRIHARMNEINAEAERIRKHEESESQYRAWKPPKVIVGADAMGKEELQVTDEPDVEAREYDLKELGRRWAWKGLNGLSSDERTAFMLASTGSLSSEDLAEHRTAAEAGVGSTGGIFVPDEAMKGIIEKRGFFGQIRKTNIKQLNTPNGRRIPWATHDSTARVGYRMGETSTIAEGTALPFGTRYLNAYSYNSTTFLFTFEQVADTSFDLYSFAEGKLAEFIERGFATECISSAGHTDSQAPEALQDALDAAGSQVSKVDLTPVPSDDNFWQYLIDLEHGVGNAYRVPGKMFYMFNDNTLRDLRKLKDGNNLPIWTRGSIVDGVPDMLNDRPYVIETNLPDVSTDPAAGAKYGIIYGNFSDEVIRDVARPMIFRLTEKYSEQQKIGFFMISRHDCRWMGVPYGTVKGLTFTSS